MNPLDAQLEAVTAMLRAAGGIVHINKDAPDDIKKAWLKILLDCPDCRKAMMGKHDGTTN